MQHSTKHWINVKYSKREYFQIYVNSEKIDSLICSWQYTLQITVCLGLSGNVHVCLLY